MHEYLISFCIHPSLVETMTSHPRNCDFDLKKLNAAKSQNKDFKAFSRRFFSLNDSSKISSSSRNHVLQFEQRVRNARVGSKIIAIIMNIKELRVSQLCHGVLFSVFPLPLCSMLSLFSKFIFNVTPDYEIAICTSQVHVHNCSRCNLKIILHGSCNYGARRFCARERSLK